MLAPSLRSRGHRAATVLSRAFWSSEMAVSVAFALLVGAGTGLGTIVFVRMIASAEGLFGAFGPRLGLPGRISMILLPALGGLLVGPLVHFLVPEAKGNGIPQVLTAIATQRGRIRGIVALAKAVTSAITIGSRGSAGREGPIVQIGSALGSAIGQLFRLSERRIVHLLASGAAAGLAAAFNAPIGGAMFALEVILGDFGIDAFGSIVIAAVTASVIGRVVLGDSPAFTVPPYALKSPVELVFYIGLGVAAGLAAVAFMKTMHRVGEAFEAWRFPPFLKPAAGGLAVGLLGCLLPQVLGTGVETITEALNGRLGLALLAILVPAKILATSLTLGSGGSGGDFAPALCIGAVLGGAYGQLVNAVAPGVAAPSGAYAMVGMAAVFAGAARAPITAILILFEMTRDYRIILPLMFATVVGTFLAERLEPDGIYTAGLKRRGIDVRARKDQNLMRAILVEEAMTPLADLTTVPKDMPLSELAKLFQETAHHGLIVLDERSELCGVVTLADLERAIEAGRMQLTVGDICTRDVLTAYPDETLDEALRHFGALGVGRIPVVDRANPRRVLGLLRRADIVRAYSHALIERDQREQHLARLRLEAATGASLLEITVQAGDAAARKRLRQIPLPEDCVIVSIHRRGRVVVPRGNTQLLPGDSIIALVHPAVEERLRAALRDGHTGAEVTEAGR